MTRRICSKVKSRTTDRASWGCLSCAYSSVQNIIIHIPVKAVIAMFVFRAARARCLLVSSGGNVRWGSLAGSPSYGAKAQILSGRQSRARGLVLVSRVATSRHPRSRPTLSMSRTSLGTAQEPFAHTDTPDPDVRCRKKVRWNSDSMLEGDKQDDSEENTDELKVRSI